MRDWNAPGHSDMRHFDAFAFPLLEKGTSIFFDFFLSSEELCMLEQGLIIHHQTPVRFRQHWGRFILFKQSRFDKAQIHKCTRRSPSFSGTDTLTWGTAFCLALATSQDSHFPASPVKSHFFKYPTIFRVSTSPMCPRAS